MLMFGIFTFVSGICFSLSGSLPLVNMSKWLQQEELQVHGIEGKIRFCFPPSTRYNKGVYGIYRNVWYYQFEFDTAQCSGSYVSCGDYDYDHEGDHFQIEREYTHWVRARPDITNHWG